MSAEDLLRSFDLIEKNQKITDFQGLNDNVLIEKAEKCLNLNFPPSYKLFLNKYGCGDVGSTEIYGLIKNNFDAEGEMNILWLIPNERKRYQLPESHIIIGGTDDGFWYVLDSSQTNADGEYPVYIYGFGEDGKSQEKVYEDFGEFLLDQVKKEIEYSLEDDDDTP